MEIKEKALSLYCSVRETATRNIFFKQALSHNIIRVMQNVAKVISTEEVIEMILKGQKVFNNLEIVDKKNHTSNHFGNLYGKQSKSTTYLNGVTFKNCKFGDDVVFFKCDLDKTMFNECIMYNAIFEQCSLKQTIFENCNIRKSTFRQSNLKLAIFRSSNIDGSYFNGCKMMKVKFNKLKRNPQIIPIEIYHCDVRMSNIYMLNNKDLLKSSRLKNYHMFLNDEPGNFVFCVRDMKGWFIYESTSDNTGILKHSTTINLNNYSMMFKANVSMLKSLEQ